MTVAVNRLAINVPEKISYSGLVDLAKRTLKENEELARQRKEFKQHIQQLEDRKLEVQQKIEEIEEQKRLWSEQWASAISPIKLPAASQPDDVMEYIDALDDIFNKLDDAKAIQQRVDAMDRNRKAFQEAVQDATDRLAPQLNSLEVEKAVATLKGILAENLQHRQQYKLLEADQRKKTVQLSEAKEKLAGNQEILHQLCTEASISDPDLLPAVERQSRHKSIVSKDAAAIKDRLAELAAGQVLPAFIENVRKQDPDTLTAELEKAETDKADLAKEREDLVAHIRPRKTICPSPWRYDRPWLSVLPACGLSCGPFLSHASAS